MNRRQFTQTLLSSSLFAADPASPNVVVILTDDLGYGDVGAYNPASKLSTPHMDRLAREGMRFTDAHSPSSVCTPTRYGILTGRYCWRSALKSGVLNGYSPALLEPGRTTLAAHLKQAGYRTGGFGKWHLGLGTAAKVDYTRSFDRGPLTAGFDEYYGIPASLDMPPYVYIDGDHAVEPPTATIADNGETARGPFWRGGPIAPGFHMEQVLPDITSRACSFIATSARARQPFFAYVPMNGPHTPWVPSKPFQGRSPAGLYGDFVAEVDASVGRILAQLEKSGVASNTIVFVTSDNGAPWIKKDADAARGHWAPGPWRGQKSDIQEAGHRIPLIARWPGRIPRGAVASDLVCLTDLYATIAELTRVPLPADPGAPIAEDSFSFASVLRDRGRSRRQAVVHHSGLGLFSIRSGEWKLVLGRGSGGFTKPVKIEPGPGEPEGELYHLPQDPREEKNLYADRPEVVARLKDLFATWQARGRSRT